VPPGATLQPTPADAGERTKPLLRGWSHLVAFGLTLIVGPILIAQAPDAWATFVLVIYVVSVAAMFGVSAAFHLKTWSPPARRRMRRLDHAMIFLAIAGSYTAVGGLALTGWARLAILALVWGGAVVGIAVRELWLDAPKWVVAVPYVVVGWAGLAVVPQLFHALGVTAFVLVVIGGAFYTAGALVYARKGPDLWPGVFGYHELFHACTVIGALIQFVVIAFFALPLA